MPVMWTPVSTQSATSWASQPPGGDDWVDSLLSLLLTESGTLMFAENDDFLAVESVAVPVSRWVPL